MTRRVCLSRPPMDARIDGVWPLPWREAPRPGELVLVQVHGERRWWLARVVAVDGETYSVEVVRVDNGREMCYDGTN